MTASRESLQTCVLWCAACIIVCAVALPILSRGWVHLETDFPNYYLLAHLRAQGWVVDRAYEWLWFQRQKDHAGLSQPLVGLGQITPFSAVLLRPVAMLPVMVAKHVWFGVNLLAASGSAILLRRHTRVGWDHLALLIASCWPLWRNFEYGQQYVVLLLLILLAVDADQRGSSFWSGFWLGVATSLKIFPAILLLVPLARGRYRALAGAALAVLLTAALSVWIFGAELCTRYILEVLPRGLHGEVANPYAVGSQSMNALLRRLFVPDASLNPHALADRPWLPSLVQNIALIAATCMVWITARRGDVVRAWSAGTLASLILSTAPASYQFVLLLLPVCFLFASEMDRAKRTWIGLAYLLSVVPWLASWAAMLSLQWLMPRWWACVFLFILSLSGSWKPARAVLLRRGLLVVGAVSVLTLLAALRPKPGLPPGFAPLPDAAHLLESHPQWEGARVASIHSTAVGYSMDDSDKADQLGLAVSANSRWIETAGRQSILRDTAGHVLYGEAPAVSPSGQYLAFLREAAGRGVLYTSAAGASPQRCSPPEHDVYEASISDTGMLAYAAHEDGRRGTRIFVLTAEGGIPREIGVPGSIRYPAWSPDGKRLAFSQQVRGNWQLRVLDLKSGVVSQTTDVPCNVIEPAWNLADSEGDALIVASDCGRGTGLTGLFRVQLR